MSQKKLEPLCVDLDGTLILTDLILERVIRVLRRHPIKLLWMLAWVLKGPLYFKQQLKDIELDVGLLPIREDLVAYLWQQKGLGHEIVLVTASLQTWGQEVALRFQGLFDAVYGSSQELGNLKGPTKAAFLKQKYPEGFTYIGDSLADIPVFEAAQTAVPVGSKSFVQRVHSRFKIDTGHQFKVSEVNWRIWVRALRVHQWTKNLLVFLPMVLAHKIAWAPFVNSVWAFLGFSFMASAIYLINDLVDLDSDRQHAKKKLRPLAAGLLSSIYAVGAALILLIGSVTVGALLSQEYLVVLIGYFILTSVYSFYLKSQLLVDVVVLAGLFTVRIFAGSAATDIVISEWLLAFSIFIFFSLAMVKRYIEILRLKDSGKGDLKGRAYQVEDESIVSTIGVASGFMAVLVLTIYMNQAASLDLYSHPKWLLGVTILMMYWISRIWLLAHRGEVDDDPIVFAIKDKPSVVAVGLAALLLWAAAV